MAREACIMNVLIGVSLAAARHSSIPTYMHGTMRVRRPAAFAAVVSHGLRSARSRHVQRTPPLSRRM